MMRRYLKSGFKGFSISLSSQQRTNSIVAPGAAEGSIFRESVQWDFHGKRFVFPRDFLSLPFLSRNNVDSAATTVVIKIGCPPPALIRPRERFTALLPLLYLFGKDVTAAAATKEQDRKKNLAKVASHTRSLVHAGGTGMWTHLVGGITPPVAFALARP